MKRITLFAACWMILLAFFPVQAQVNSVRNSQSQVRGQMDLEGRVYLPNGLPLAQSIRIQLHSDDGVRAPEYIFTDSSGHFVLERIVVQVRYILTIEGDGKHWGTTVYTFGVTGEGGGEVNVYLAPPGDTAAPLGPTVSARALKQKIPAAARKQFDAGVKKRRAGDPVEGERCFERAIGLFPDYVEAHNEIAVQLMKAGNFAHAQEHVQRALQVDPDAVRPLVNLGLCLQRQGRSADALPYLERAAQLRPADPAILLAFGDNLLLAGEDARAEAQLLRAYEIGGAAVARAQLFLAEIYSRRKEFSKAAAAVATYLRDVPGDRLAADLEAALNRFRAAAQQQH